jgi:colicin import membrane protein
LFEGLLWSAVPSSSVTNRGFMPHGASRGASDGGTREIAAALFETSTRTQAMDPVAAARASAATAADAAALCGLRGAQALADTAAAIAARSSGGAATAEPRDAETDGEGEAAAEEAAAAAGEEAAAAATNAAAAEEAAAAPPTIASA